MGRSETRRAESPEIFADNLLAVGPPISKHLDSHELKVNEDRKFNGMQGRLASLAQAGAITEKQLNLDRLGDNEPDSRNGYPVRFDYHGSVGLGLPRQPITPLAGCSKQCKCLLLSLQQPRTGDGEGRARQSKCNPTATVAKGMCRQKGTAPQPSRMREAPMA